MIDAERLLGTMMRGGLRGKKKRGRGIGSSALAAGAVPLLAGVAFAAAEHFLQNRKGGQAAGGAAPGHASTPPPPPPPRSGPVTGPFTGPTTGTPEMPPPIPGQAGPPGLPSGGTGGAPEVPGAVPPPPGPPPVEPTPVPDDADNNAEALLLIRFMIAAAKADGVIDADERRAILNHLEEAGADDEAYAFVSREMLAPLDLDALVAEIHDPRVAVEAYTVSLMAIDADTEAEQAHLRTLAERLGLDAETVAGIGRQLDQTSA